jgi:hypothetical protein
MMHGAHLGPESLIGTTPEFAEGETHVIDKTGCVWLLVHDGGMVTRADTTGRVWSAGTAWLAASAGPLVGLNPIKLRAEAQS